MYLKRLRKFFSKAIETGYGEKSRKILLLMAFGALENSLKMCKICCPLYIWIFLDNKLWLLKYNFFVLPNIFSAIFLKVCFILLHKKKLILFKRACKSYFTKKLKIHLL